MFNRISYFNSYRLLFELERAFEGELDFSALSKNILNVVLTETEATAGVIYWMDEIQNEFKLKTVQGVPLEMVNTVTKVLRKPGGVLERIQNEPAGLLLKPTDFEAGLYHLGELNQTYHSLIAITLSTPVKTLGALIIFRSLDAFPIKYHKALYLFAPRAAVQLDNARLYQLAKETAAENARLYVNISKLYQQATMDELTGLYNRAFFLQRVKEEINKAWRFKQALSLIFVDIDHFKSINDECGRPIGDQLLLEFGEFLKKSIREYDVACRFGGEQFAILFPQTQPDNALDLAERLRQKTMDRKFCGNKRVAITVSFGVSCFSNSLNSSEWPSEEHLNSAVEKMVKEADEALNQAKNAGRNRVASFTETA